MKDRVHNGEHKTAVLTDAGSEAHVVFVSIVQLILEVIRMGKSKDGTKEKTPMLFGRVHSKRNGYLKSTKSHRSIWTFTDNEWRLSFGKFVFIFNLTFLLFLTFWFLSRIFQFQ